MAGSGSTLVHMKSSAQIHVSIFLVCAQCSIMRSTRTDHNAATMAMHIMKIKTGQSMLPEHTV